MTVPKAEDSVKITKDGVIKVYCVECEKWRLVCYQTMAFVAFSQSGNKTVEETVFNQGLFQCLFCKADVDYIFGLNPGMAERFLRGIKG